MTWQRAEFLSEDNRCSPASGTQPEIKTKDSSKSGDEKWE